MGYRKVHANACDSEESNPYVPIDNSYIVNKVGQSTSRIVDKFLEYFGKEIGKFILDKFAITFSCNVRSILANTLYEYVKDRDPSKVVKINSITSMEALKAALAKKLDKDYFHTEDIVGSFDFGSAIFKVGEKAWVWIRVKQPGVGSSQHLLKATFFGKGAYRSLYEFIKTLKTDYVYQMYSCYSVLNESGRASHSRCIDIGEVPKVNDENYILSEETYKTLFEYLSTSMKFSRYLYEKFKIVKPIGIIISGEPGTGKTSLVNYISYKIGTHIIQMDASSINTCAECVSEEGIAIDPAPIFLFNDIDVIVGLREEAKDKFDKTNFQNLLSFFDGGYGFPNSINIITTNRPEKLDPALTRYGRFDLHIELKGLKEPEAKRFCSLYNLEPESILANKTFPVNPSLLQKEIIDRLKGSNLNMLKGEK